MHTQWHSSRFELRYVSVKFYYNNIFHPISINTAVVHRMAGKVYSYQLLSNPDKSCLHFALCSQSIPFSWSMHIAVVVDLIDKQSLLCTEVYHSQTSIFYVCELLSRYSKKILAQSTLSTPYIILSQVDLVGNFIQSIFVIVALQLHVPTAIVPVQYFIPYYLHEISDWDSFHMRFWKVKERVWMF